MSLLNFTDLTEGSLAPFIASGGSAAVDTVTPAYTGTHSLKLPSNASQSNVTFGLTSLLNFNDAELYAFVATRIGVSAAPSAQVSGSGGIIFQGTVTFAQVAWVWKTDGTVAGRVAYDNGGGLTQVGSDQPLALDTWHQIILHHVKSASVGKLRLYIAGVPVVEGLSLNTGTDNMIQLLLYGSDASNGMTNQVNHDAIAVRTDEFAGATTRPMARRKPRH